MSYEMNTDALARNQEGSITNWPKDKKEPISLYTQGENKKATAYSWETMRDKNGIIYLHGLETKDGFRGLYIKVTIGPKLSNTVKVVVSSTDKKKKFEFPMTPELLIELWPGGPYSFLKAIVEIEKKLADKGHEPWLQQYLLEGGIGSLLNIRMSFQDLFKKIPQLFN